MFTRTYIVNYIRKLSFRDPNRAKCRNKIKVDQALHRCSNCSVLCYEGKSKYNLAKLREKYNEEILEAGIELDHREPVDDSSSSNFSWDSFIERLLLTNEDSYQGLCFFCHKIKSMEEKIDKGTSTGEYEVWDKFLEKILYNLEITLSDDSDENKE